MENLDSILNRLQELDEKQESLGGVIDDDITSELFKELDKLFPIYLDLPQDSQLRVKEFVASHSTVSLMVIHYIKHAAKQIETPEDINWFKNALIAIVIDNNNFDQYYPPLEQLYINAHEADLNPDEHIEKMLSIAELKKLRSLQDFSQSDRFKRRTVKKPGQDQLLSQIEALFDKDTQTLLTDLINLSNKQELWDINFDKELSRLMRQENKPYSEAEKILEETLEPSYKDEIYNNLDVLCAVYLDMNVDQRGVVKRVINTHNGLFSAMAGYTGRATNKLRQEADLNVFRYGLVAAAIEDGSLDYRDTLMHLGSLYQVAYNGGLAPDKHYREIGKKLDSKYVTTFTKSAHFTNSVKPKLDPSLAPKSWTRYLPWKKS